MPKYLRPQNVYLPDRTVNIVLQDHIRWSSQLGKRKQESGITTVYATSLPIPSWSIYRASRENWWPFHEPFSVWHHLITVLPATGPRACYLTD